MSLKERFFIIILSTKITIFVVALSALLYPQSAEAKRCNRQPMNLSANIMDFETINTVAYGGYGNIIMGGNGNINYGAGYSGPGFGIGGQLTITADSGCKVSIYCMPTATLTDGTGNQMTLTNIEFNTSSRNYGGGTRCAGMNVPVDTNANVNKTYYFGGILDGTNGVPSFNPTFQQSIAAGRGLL